MKMVISLLLIMSSILLCQDDTATEITTAQTTVKDSINIRQLLMQQISRVKNEKIVKSVNLTDFKEQIDTKTKSASVSVNWFQRIFIFADFSLAVMLVIVWRRKKQSINKEVNSRLKKNVIRLRNDRISSRDDLQLSTLRTNLLARSLGKRYDDENIAIQARQLSISKGELFLASKLKSIKRNKNARASY